MGAVVMATERDTTATPTEIVGYCPMGCGRTLFRADGGYITCSFISCPNPLAVGEILGDRETEHLVEFGPSTFKIRHPLRERVDDALMTCQLHAHVESLPGPPVQPGLYRARVSGGAWTWERLPDLEVEHA